MNKEKCLDKIIQYILEDTEIDRDNKIVRVYFTLSIGVSFLFESETSHRIYYKYPRFISFTHYCYDKYGLDNFESGCVCKKYLELLKFKVKDYVY